MISIVAGLKYEGKSPYAYEPSGQPAELNCVTHAHPISCQLGLRIQEWGKTGFSHPRGLSINTEANLKVTNGYFA